MFPLRKPDSFSLQYSYFKNLLDDVGVLGYQGLSQEQERDLVTRGFNVYRGKVRDCLVKGVQFI